MTLLMALSTQSGNKSELPAIERTLPLAERFHREIVGRAGRGKRVNCPELTGQDEHGQHLRGRHQHAHILPLDLDHDGHLDHVLIHAAMGLGVTAQTAIRTMKQSSSQGGATDLRVALVGRGDLNSLHALPGSFRTATQKLLSPIDACQTWISVTPFVAPRYLKRSGKNNLAGQVNAELASRGLPKATEVEILPWDSDNVNLRHFVRVRSRDKLPPPSDTGYALRLQLAKPITGPLTLGYASHFGIGLFQAVEEDF